MELKILLVELTHILALGHLLEVLLQLDELAVLPRVVGQDGDAVFELEDVGVGSIVHQHHTAQIPIYYSQILRIDILMNLYTIFTVEPVLDILPLRVQLVKHDVSVGLVAGSEGDDLIELGHPLEEADSIRTNSNVGFGS